MVILGILFFCLKVNQAFSSDDSNDLRLIVKNQNEKKHELEEKYEKLLNVVLTQNKNVMAQTRMYVNERYQSLYYDMEELKNKSMYVQGGNLQTRRKDRMSRGLPVATPVAFYAYMTHIMTSVGEHHQLVFDVVKTNIGGGYHQSGVFIVPESGIYVFTWSFRVHNEGYHAVELDVNGNRMGVAYSLAHNNVSDQTSATIVISVKKGDDVYLRTGHHNNKGEIYTDSYGYTYFAGWKI